MFEIDLARARLRGLAEDAQNLRDRIREIVESIPPAAIEGSQEDLAEPDPATDLRAVLATILHDCAEPMIVDLLAAGEPEREGAPPGAGADAQAMVRLDLRLGEARMAKLVEALVVKDYFTARADEDEPREIWLPPYTAEQAGLTVFKAWGAWFAVWRKLEVPDGAPEDERWERLRIDELQHRRGSLGYQEI